MNFKKLIFIIYILSSISGQVITTPQTIKPVVELDPIEDNVLVSFIGIEGETKKGGTVNYKKAKIYNILKNYTITEEKTIISLDEKDSNYFAGAKKGDITGEGIPEVVFFISSPTTGTQIWSYSINPGWNLKRVHDPFSIRSRTQQPTLLNTSLSPVYKDKDKEIILSFGAPDRKIMVVNYSGELTSKTIAKKFLENNVGVIKFLTPDLNKDNAADIYILSNNPGLKEEQVFLSPNHSTNKKPKQIEIKENIKDVVFIKNKEEQLKTFLLENNEVYVGGWEKKFPTGIQKAEKFIVYDEGSLSIINQLGEVAVFEIGDKTIKPKQTIRPFFKHTQFNQVNHLVLSNGQILISHNDLSNSSKSEITLQSFLAPIDKPLVNTGMENKTEKEVKEEALFTETANAENEDENEEKTTEREEKTLQNEEPLDAKKIPARITKKIKADTTIVNIGEKNSISIPRNTKYSFVGLEKTQGPKEMQLNKKQMIFEWEPKEKDLGYNNLLYNITYNTSSELEEFYEEGKQKLRPKKELENHEYVHTIFVNAPPIIKVSPSTKYEVNANKEMVVPIYINDPNTEHNNKLLVQFEPSNLEEAYIEDRKFFWTPQNKHFGNNEIKFTVSDGFLNTSIDISVTVDTTKMNLGAQLQEFATVNEEFLHKLPLVSGAKASILEAPENVRVSKDGHIHWIPTKPQLGQNPVTIEINEEKQTLLYSINVFVNAPPVISFRPDDTVYVNLNENFSFTLKSFEENENQPLFWSLKDGPEKMIFKSGELSWDATAPDIHPYTIELTDTLDSDIFYGTLYVNDAPKIISVPPKYVNLGETYIYNITVKDANTLSPQGKINNPILFLKNGPTGMKLENNKIEWTPRLDQIGASPVNIEVFDKVQKTEQDFIVYVNDVPKIISTDSLRIAVGDTLHHFVRAQDANEVTDLSYGINADLDNLLMNPKTGEIVWTPAEKDLGYNSIQVSVSDQFDSLGKDSQTLTILVYKNPSFIDIVFPEAYAGAEYIHDIKAENMNKQNIPGKDVFINMVETTFKEARFDTMTHTFVAFPSLDEMGVQSATFILEDSYLNQITETFPIKVLTSPCETSDTTYIAASNDETIERSSTLTKTNYYKKETSILEKTGLLKEDSPPVQYVEIAEINKTEIIDTVFLEKEDINKYLPHLAKALGNNSTSNKLSKKDLRKIKKIQRKKEKAAKKQKREKPQITFNRNKQETEYNDNISFKPAPKELPEKVDLHKIKNETIRKTILAVLETPADKAEDIKEEEISPPPIDLGHNIRGDKTHITKNKWVQNKEKNSDGRIQLNYDELFYYPGEEFNYKANYWDGVKGKGKRKEVK